MAKRDFERDEWQLVANAGELPEECGRAAREPFLFGQVPPLLASVPRNLDGPRQSLHYSERRNVRVHLYQLQNCAQLPGSPSVYANFMDSTDPQARGKLRTWEAHPGP